MAPEVDKVMTPAVVIVTSSAVPASVAVEVAIGVVRVLLVTCFSASAVDAVINKGTAAAVASQFLRFIKDASCDEEA
jgi:hypothetical protein